MTQGLFNSGIEVRLPQTPEVTDPALYKELSIIYAAIKQLQFGVDTFLDIPPKFKSEVHTLDISDRGLSIDTTANVIVPLEVDSDLTIGATIVVTNVSNESITILAASEDVTLITAGTVQFGDKLLANFGVASLRYLGGDSWIVLGAGLSGV